MSSKLLDFTVFIAAGTDLTALAQYAVHIKAPSAHAAYIEAGERLAKEKSLKWLDIAASVTFEGFHNPKDKHVVLLKVKDKVKKEFFVTNKKK
jgi:hypothetical protein